MSNVLELRPQSFHDYVGQEHIKKLLRMAVGAAKMRGEPLDHILLSGPAGMGKTTLANVIANELGAGFVVINAASLESTSQITDILMALSPFDVVFIDEIHRLSIKAEELLYHPMEDGVLESQEIVEYKTPRFSEEFTRELLKLGGFGVYDVLYQTTKQKETIVHDLPPFTLIGATTNAGGLSKPLRDRFPLSLQLALYSLEEMELIVKQKCQMLEIEITDSAARNLAGRSRSTARVAVNFVRRCRDTAQMLGQNIIDDFIVNTTLDMMRVDKMGLTEADRQYLQVLADNKRPTGLKTLASQCMQDEDTIQNVLEPYLMQMGFVARQSNGRIITSKGLRYLGLR